MFSNVLTFGIKTVQHGAIPVDRIKTRREGKGEDENNNVIMKQ